MPARLASPSGSLGKSATEELTSEVSELNRTENVHILDFRVEKGLKLGRAGHVTGMIDIFNITNANPITNFRVVTGPQFKQVITLLDPRIVRFGVRYDF